MKKICFLVVSGIFAVMSCLTFTGCMNNDFAGSTYSRGQAKTPNSIVEATVVAFDYAKIEGTEGVVGGVAGGVLGAAVGNTIGGGTGKTVARVGGAVGGALAGAAIENAATTRNALQITVKYDNGVLGSVVQEAGVDSFFVGQRVMVITNTDGSMRVRPSPNL